MQSVHLALNLAQIGPPLGWSSPAVSSQAVAQTLQELPFCHLLELEGPQQSLMLLHSHEDQPESASLGTGSHNATSCSGSVSCLSVYHASLALSRVKGDAAQCIRALKYCQWKMQAVHQSSLMRQCTSSTAAPDVGTASTG